MRLARFEMDMISLAMSLSLSGAGRESGFSYRSLAEPEEIDPQVMQSCLRAARGSQDEEFELWRERAPGSVGQGPQTELRHRLSGAGLTLHWPEQGAQSEPIAVEIDQAALFERLATPAALSARRAEFGEANWAQEIEREAFILGLGQVWAALESEGAESEQFSARLAGAPIEIAPGAGVYGPAAHELTDKKSGERWLVSRADNGILSLERSLGYPEGASS